jgi:CelD/BcsL family acetyltransferase involved in cellulose biosynthesis
MVHIDAVVSFEELLKLRDEWKNLVLTSKIEHPFSTFEWISCWWKSFGSNYQLLVLVARENGRIAGIAPLMRARIKHRGVWLKAITFIANDHTSRTDFILADNRSNILSAIISHLLETNYDNDIYLLDCLSKDSENCILLSEILIKGGIKHSVKASLLSPFIKIEKTWGEFLNGSSKHLTKKINSWNNNFKSIADLEIIKYSDKDIDKAICELLLISRKTWKYRTGSAIASNKDTISFYSLLAKEYAQNGWLNLWILKIKSKPISFLFGINYENKFFALKSGFDEEYSKISPCNYLNVCVFQSCFNNKMTEIDLLGQNEPYKVLWTNLNREHAVFQFYGNTIIGKLIYFTEAYIVNWVKACLELLKLRRITKLEENTFN